MAATLEIELEDRVKANADEMINWMHEWFDSCPEDMENMAFIKRNDTQFYVGDELYNLSTIIQHTITEV